ncbi:hypothetical protein TNCV_4982261 [Trichonephila clavipes]|nr:hypothetical protein TNCV_4982261 [Trichonephila clavipes]
MIFHTCLLGDRSSDLAVQGNMSTICSAHCVTTAMFSVSRPQAVWMQAFIWPPYDQNSAMIDNKAGPASVRKHNRCQLYCPMNSSLKPLALQTQWLGDSGMQGTGQLA